jgi:hypothetical protein
MDSKQIFMIVAIVAALNTVMMATPVMAQNVTGGNMTGKISSIDPPADFFGRSGCPVDAEGIERCPPPQEQTDSNEETNGNGNGDASDDGNGGDSSNGNENGDN